MAKLPELISKFARFDPRGVSGVENLSRELRKADLITRGKRGVGAPDMTETDVTNMLFAMASRQANEAPAAVSKLRNASLVSPWDGEPDPIDWLATLPIWDHIFDAERFVRAGLFVDAVIREYARHGIIQPRDGGDPVHDIELEILDPLSGSGTVRVVFNRFAEDEIILTFTEHSAPLAVGIQHAAIVNSEVLFILANVLKEEE